MNPLAILVPSADVSTTAFIHAIRTELRELGTEDTKPYTLYHEDAPHRLEEALKENRHPVLITYGPSCTELGRSLARAHQSPVTLICASVALLEAEKDEKLIPLNTSLGAYLHNLFLIFPFMPMIRKALILYDENDSAMVTLQEKFAAYLRERADAKEVVTVYPLQQPLIRRDIILIADHHIVMVLAHHPKTTDVQRLARLCAEHKTVLYMNETNAVDYGAALGMGLNDVELGKTAAGLAHQVITNEKAPLPKAVTLDCQLRINASALAQQGLPMMRVAPLLSLIEATTLVNPTPQAKVAAYLRMEHIPLE